MLRFAFCSKEYGARLSYKQVVRSALMTGGRAKQNMERIVPLIEARKIWVPSPQRLLRLMCGKRCERCHKKQVNLVEKSFGVFYCFDTCIKATTKQVSPNSKKWLPYVPMLKDERVAIEGLHWLSMSPRLMKAPQRDANGDKIGPVVTSADMETMMK